MLGRPAPEPDPYAEVEALLQQNRIQLRFMEAQLATNLNTVRERQMLRRDRAMALARRDELYAEIARIGTMLSNPPQAQQEDAEDDSIPVPRLPGNAPAAGGARRRTRAKGKKRRKRKSRTRRR